MEGLCGPEDPSSGPSTLTPGVDDGAVTALVLGGTAAMLLLNGLAAWWDIRSRTIPNLLVVGGAGVALAWRLLADGSLLDGSIGLGAGLALGLGLFALGVLGAGDGKLIAANGAFLGWSQLGPALLAMGVAGGVLALVTATYRGRLGKALSGAGYAILYLVTLGRLGALPAQTGPDERPGLPYGVAIAAGALATWFWRYL